MARNDDSRVTLTEVLGAEDEYFVGPRDPTNERTVDALIARAYQSRRSALCLSGGGIRSATFGLGFLQGVASRGGQASAGGGLLRDLHYLSTVSGGGYVGSWLSALIHRVGLAGAAERLVGTRPNSVLGEYTAVQHLRMYSNYLTPKLGLLSADSWTLAATVARNLVVHWALLLPPLLAVLCLPHLGRDLLAAWAAVPGTAGTLVPLGGAALFAIAAIAFVEHDLPSLGRAGHGERGFFLCFLLPLGAATYLLVGALHHASSAGWPLPAGATPWLLAAAAGACVHLAGFVLGRFRALATATSVKQIGWLALSGGVGGTLLLSLAVVLSRVTARVEEWLANVLAPSQPTASPLVEFQATATLVLGPAAVLLALFAATATYVLLLARWTDEEDREWWARASAWTMILGVGWGVCSALVLVAAPWLAGWSGQLGWFWSAGATAGTVVGGRQLARIGYQSAETIGRVIRQSAGWRVKLGRLALPLASGAVLAVLLCLLAVGLDLLLATLEPAVAPAISGGPALGRLCVSTLCVVGFAALALGLARLIPINTFSLHAMYGNRLVRAYLGASRGTGRRPHPFTGFDRADNLGMDDLLRRPNGDAVPPEERRLFHVVNVALNLVAGDQLSWQQRKAQSFTISPLHSGSPTLGAAGSYRRSAEYGGGVTLGRAMTISGAAASPNMGYHSSTLVAGLMTFFNVRLGWWMPNPSEAGDGVWQLSNPLSSVRWIASEALGLTTARKPFVYLSDGGHFDNLGLYEMVLRRCATIVAVDAGEDADLEFSDLASVIRMVRADFGIEIDFPDGVFPAPGDGDGTPRFARRWAVGAIRYPAGPSGEPREGKLLYVKPVLLGDEPRDVQRYAAEHARDGDRFPHQSTGDQWFDESQFESMRILGRHTFASIYEAALAEQQLHGEATGSLGITELVALLERAQQRTPGAQAPAPPPTATEVLAAALLKSARLEFSTAESTPPVA